MSNEKTCDCDYWHSEHRWHCSTNYDTPTPEPSEVAETTAGEREVEALILAALRESRRDDYSPQTVAAGVARAVLASPWLAAHVSAAETKARAEALREAAADALNIGEDVLPEIRPVRRWLLDRADSIARGDAR